MRKIEYPKNIKLSDYDLNNKSPKVFYGLSPRVIFCKKCAMSNQKPISTVEFKNSIEGKKIGINLNEDGICDPCKVNEKKNNEVDWKLREKELQELCDKYRKSDGRYDCIVPGSGGKDSFYASHILKTKYKMNPLTVAWAPNIFTEWGWKNFQSWIGSGQDNYLVTTNTRVKRLLTRLAIEKLLHPFQPFVLGQRIIPPKIAAMMDIKLIFYGENEAEYNNPAADFFKPKRNPKTWALNKNNYSDLKISGVPLNDLINYFGINKNELSSYLPLDENLMMEKELQVHYLGYYLKWDQQGKYYYAVKHGGFIPSPYRTPGTYSKYNSIDDKMDDLHFITTSIKYGVSRVNYDVSQEIRNGDISIEEGKALVKKYQYEFPTRFEDELYEYLSLPSEHYPEACKMFEEPLMNREYFLKLLDTFRSPHIWYKKDDRWLLRTTFY